MINKGMAGGWGSIWTACNPRFIRPDLEESMLKTGS